MEAIIRELLVQILLILSGLPLRWQDVEEKNQKTVIILALHCILNGPVGVQKSTTFPLVGGPHKITDFIKTTNSSWRGFCQEVATIVKKVNPEIDCNTRRKHNDYWPLAGNQ